MHTDRDDLIASDAELLAVRARLGIAPGPLDVIADVPPAEDVTVPAEVDLESIMQTLSDPAKIVEFHYTIADESLTRSVLTFRGDTIVAATRIDTTTRIVRPSRTSLSQLVAEVLASNSGTRPQTLALSLSSAGLFTWLAIVDQVRLMRLDSMIRHYAPKLMIAPADVGARIADGPVEDFRWAVPFFARVLPFDLAATVTDEDVALGLRELSAVDLIEQAGGDLYDLTPKGEQLAVEMVHDVSKVALGVTAYRDDGTFGYEQLLFIRSSNKLFLLDVAGGDAVIAGLSADELDRFLDDVLAPAEVVEPAVPREPTTPERPQAPPPVLPPMPSSPPPVPTTVPPVPAARFCPACGVPVEADDRFCRNCGAALD